MLLDSPTKLIIAISRRSVV